MPNDDHRLAIEAGQAADDRVVVGKGPVTMQLFGAGG
jgi:hypothetical protein